ncbi:hypothetical protein [Nitrosopumilus sp.]|uniref:hypothetical protein n=1 Tax=Nitrosopumilus sp. TaxID=2024843 RepID=UPI002601DDFE|nr:hypothetical protein [Nitrosopumilus sp.]
MAEITQEILMLLGVIISAGGISGAIFYNALKLKQNTKSQYYQILKDIDERHHQIEEYYDDPHKQLMHRVNFGQFMKQLIDMKIIPKKFLIQTYKYDFSDALWILNRMEERHRNEPDSIEFVKFCDENNIIESEPDKQLQDIMYNINKNNQK